MNTYTIKHCDTGYYIHCGETTIVSGLTHKQAKQVVETYYKGDAAYYNK